MAAYPRVPGVLPSDPGVNLPVCFLLTPLPANCLLSALRLYAQV